MSLGPSELLIIFIILIGIAAIGVPLYGGIDAARRPAPAWQRSGENQMLWVLGQLLGAFFCGIVGLVFAVIYLTQIRDRVITAEKTL